MLLSLTALIGTLPSVQFLREEGEEVEEMEGGRGSPSYDCSGCGLPAEVLELILAQLPLPQLYYSCRLVCRVWNNIIQREKVGRMRSLNTVPFLLPFLLSLSLFLSLPPPLPPPLPPSLSPSVPLLEEAVLHVQEWLP